MDGITAARLRAHVEHLADDAMLGRETGTPQALQAAQYLSQTLTGFGLTPPPGDDDLLAEYSLYRYGYDRGATSLAVSAGDTRIDGALGGNWRPFDFSDPGAVEGPVVFAGYGITAPEHDWDDYEGLEVDGKFVFVFRHEPGEDDEDSVFDGVESSSHSTFVRKATNAAEHGAVGYLLVTDPLHHESADDLRVDGRLVLKPREGRGRGESQGPEFRAAQIDRATAEALVAVGGHDLTKLQEAVDGGASPASFDLGDVRASLSVALREEPETVPERNVVAVIEGSERPDEWVVVGAHYDHIGGYVGEGDTVFNGADDNASGTAGLLELARAYATRPTPPKRSVVFMGFSGEERGLLGSKSWVAEHESDVDKVVFMLNLDMIGRNADKPIEIYGDGYGTGLASIVTAAAERGGLANMELAGDAYFGASDHDPFYRADVPFMFFFTGTHEDYHQLGDHVDKVDFGRMERIVRTAYHVLEPIVDAEATPEFVHHVGWLGVTIEAGVVTAVDEGGRGAKAGVQVGDVLAAVGTGERATLVTAGTVGVALRGIDPGTSTTLSLRRGDEGVAVAINRAKVGYLGIFPGGLSDEERTEHGLLDDAGIKVNGMADGGPAATSGLKDGDIIVQMAGTPISRRSLRQVLQRIGAGESVETRVIRGGEPMTLSVVLGERPERR